MTNLFTFECSCEVYGKKMPSGPFTVRLASMFIRPGRRRMNRIALLVAGGGGGRMDLVVARVERTTVLNVSG